MIINLINLSQDSTIPLGESIRNVSTSSWNSLCHFCFKNDQNAQDDPWGLRRKWRRLDWRLMWEMGAGVSLTACVLALYSFSWSKAATPSFCRREAIFNHLCNGAHWNGKSHIYKSVNNHSKLTITQPWRV